MKESIISATLDEKENVNVDLKWRDEKEMFFLASSLFSTLIKTIGREKTLLLVNEGNKLRNKEDGIIKKIYRCNEDGVTEWCVAKDKKEAYEFMIEQWGKDTMDEYEEEYFNDNPELELDDFIEEFFTEEDPESEFTLDGENGKRTCKISEWLEDIDVIPSYFACENF